MLSLRTWGPRAGLIVGCFFLLSCRSAGIRRAYMSLDSAGNRRVYGDNAVFFQDDSEINAIAEVVSGRPDVEVGCRWTVSGVPGTIDGEGVRNLPGPPKSEHNFAILKYPGRGENILNVCTVRKRSAGGDTRPEDIPWGFPGFGRVDWYIDGELLETTGFEVRNEKRYIEDVAP